MFRNYLQVALRNLIKNPLYSAINIIGLAVGLAACILISLFVRDELSYDEQWVHADSVYRLNTTIEVPGREPFVTVVAQGPAKHALESYFAEDIEAVTRFQSQTPVVKHGDRAFTEEFHWTDPETVDLFDLTPIAGDLRHTLTDNASLAVNRSFAIKHFGSTDAVGEVLNVKIFDLDRDFRIGAVFEDLPHNTVLDFQVLAMIDEGDWSNQPYLFENWFSVNNNTFFKLREGASIESVRRGIRDFTNSNIQIPRGAFSEGDINSADYIRFTAQPLTEIQLNPRGIGEMKATGDSRTVAVFAVIAGLTLLIACINFMNLATSRSTQRAREVAMRKVLGAQRSQLVLQFLGESVLLALLGLLLGMVLVELLLPVYANFLERDLVFSYTDGFSLSVLLGLVVVVGVLGGVYPALVLSAFKPARVLKANKSAESKGSATMRHVLVVFQFTVSIALIVATATVYGQMRYATSMDPGFEKEQLLALSGAGRPGAAEKQEVLLQRLRAIPGVTSVSATSEVPFSSNESNTTIRLPENPEAGAILIGFVQIDYDFLDTMKVPVVAGRNYSRDFALDSFPDQSTLKDGDKAYGNVILNEAAVRRMGLGTAQEALGREFVMGLTEGENGAEGFFTVVGVVADMHLQSLKRLIRPELYLLSKKPQANVMLRFSGDPRTAAGKVESLWTSLFPDVPVDYEFVDEVAAKEFSQERDIATMLGTFSALAVIIACLGLYGLASFTAERRTKEIGIRRVLGAKVSNIVGLLLWQFSKPVLLANLVAWPIAVWGMLTWLESFPYRIDAWLLAPLCLLAGIIALSISWLTVGGNAARVARRSPIEALRYE